MSENGSGNGSRSISELMQDHDLINDALDKAFYRAVKLHREAHVDMVFCKDGKTVLKDPWDITIPEKYKDLEPFRY
jgi:hypothetical protein